MLALVEGGMTASELGRRLGISRERVRQRLNAARAQRRRRNPATGRAEISADGDRPRPPDLLRPAEAANLLGLSDEALRTAAVNGEIDCIKTPDARQRRYPRRAVLEFARKHQRPVPDA